MKERTMTVSEVSKSFSKVVSRVQSRQASTLILKLGKPVPRIVPVAEENNSTVNLAAAWPRLSHLALEDAAQLERDIAAGRRSLPPFKSAWD